jgi:hypothetical protein
LQALDLDRIYRGYGVPNDILAKLNVFGFRIAQVPIEPVYNVGEKSKMKVSRVVFPISLLLLKLFFYRLFHRYLVRDFHPLFLFYLGGILFSLLGLTGGAMVAAVAAANAPGIPFEAGALPDAMLFFAVLVLSGIHLVLFAMWMDRSENKSLQIDILQDREAPGEEGSDGIADRWRADAPN